MRADLRRALSLAGVLALLALAAGLAAVTARDLVAARAGNAGLEEQLAALRSREAKIGAAPGRADNVSPLFAAETITLAAAALQQRLEAAVAKANGRLVSARVETGSRTAPRRLALTADLAIAEPDLQALLFDLETGRPYLFVETVEARAPQAATPEAARTLDVSLAVAGEWSGTK